MKKRIGNDITFTWHIYRKDGDTQVPESFTGKEVEVKLISPLQRPVTIEDVTIATGVVTFTFRGKHQVTLGNYVAVLLENKGENGMITLDVVNAVTLVAHSYMEEDGDDGDVIEVESVELTSTISAGGGGGFVQQQADWAQTDETAVDYIKNKPDLDVYVPKMDSDGHGNMTIYSQGTITMTRADEQGVVNQTGSFWAGGWSVYSPQGKFQTFGNSIYRGTMGLDHDSVVWERTATQQIPAATTSANGLMSAEDKDKLDALPTATQLAEELGNKANAADLAEVATSGSYNDLTDKPTIPAAQVQSDWNESDTTSKAFIRNKPTIPTVPTDVSAFNNDAGYLTASDVANKQDTINDLPAIRSGAQAGATAVQSSDLAPVATSGSYNDLTNKPTIPKDAANVSYDNTKTGLSATNVQDAIDEMADTNLYETVVLTIGSADSSFNPVAQTITVTLEDGSATQYTVPISRQITFIVQRGMRYTISGTSTDDYRVLPISVKAAIPTRYLTMRYIPIATGVFILQNDGNYYLREEYDAETMAEDAVGVLVLTSALINAKFGIVIAKTNYTATKKSNSNWNNNITALAGRNATVASLAYDNQSYADSLSLVVNDKTLLGYIAVYAEWAIVAHNQTEIINCQKAINAGWTMNYRQPYVTSTLGGENNIRIRTSDNGLTGRNVNLVNLPFFYYPLS